MGEGWYYVDIPWLLVFLAERLEYKNSSVNAIFKDFVNALSQGGKQLVEKLDLKSMLCPTKVCSPQTLKHGHANHNVTRVYGHSRLSYMYQCIRLLLGVVATC
jgi:hypothetical protein